PYDVAALVLVFKEINGCTTVVHQHGLILSPQFYFPTHAQEFWGWGHLSEAHYHSRSTDRKLIITGRFASDRRTRVTEPYIVSETRKPSLLLATSFSHTEVIRLLKLVRSTLPTESI